MARLFWISASDSITSPATEMMIPIMTAVPVPLPLSSLNRTGEVSHAYSSAAEIHIPHFAAMDMVLPSLISPTIFLLYEAIRSSLYDR